MRLHKVRCVVRLRGTIIKFWGFEVVRWPSGVETEDFPQHSNEWLLVCRQSTSGVSWSCGSVKCTWISCPKLMTLTVTSTREVLQNVLQLKLKYCRILHLSVFASTVQLKMTYLLWNVLHKVFSNYVCCVIWTNLIVKDVCLLREFPLLFKIAETPACCRPPCCSTPMMALLFHYSHHFQRWS